MPQDIPLEASEALAFTPSSIASLPGAPAFTLRAATPREKRMYRRFMLEEGLRLHSEDAIRAEVRAGLKAMWSDESFDQHMPMVEDYWSALDDFVLQRKDHPDIKWSYDPDLERAIGELIMRIEDAWKPLRLMRADNADFSEMTLPIMVAVVVSNFTGIDVAHRVDRGYLTLQAAENIREALSKFEKVHAKEHGLTPGTAWLELFTACSRRMYLDEDEAGNSESPSPSSTPPELSSEPITSGTDGKSPASASSTETPATA